MKSSFEAGGAGGPGGPGGLGDAILSASLLGNNPSLYNMMSRGRQTPSRTSYNSVPMQTANSYISLQQLLNGINSKLAQPLSSYSMLNQRKVAYAIVLQNQH